MRLSQVSSLLKQLHKQQTARATTPLPPAPASTAATSTHSKGATPWPFESLPARTHSLPAARVLPVHTHTIICGDFNEGAEGAVSELLQTGVIEANRKDEYWGVSEWCGVERIESERERTHVLLGLCVFGSAPVLRWC